MLLSLRVQMCLLSSVEFLSLAWRNDEVWFLYLVLKSFSVSPMCRLNNPTRSGRQSQQKDPRPYHQHNREKTQLQPMEKHHSRNQLIQIYRKQTTLQLHLFRHRRVLSIHQPRPPKQSVENCLRVVTSNTQ